MSFPPGCNIGCNVGSHNVTCHQTQANTPDSTPASTLASTRFTYPGGIVGWVDVGDLIAPRSGVKPATAWSKVRHPNCCATIHTTSVLDACPLRYFLRHPQGYCLGRSVAHGSTFYYVHGGTVWDTHRDCSQSVGDWALAWSSCVSALVM